MEGKRTYGLWFADEFGDDGGGLGEDGGCVNAVQADVGGKVEARHLLLLSAYCCFSLFHCSH